MSESRIGAWIRWALFAEGLILLLALAGPGYRHALVQDGDHGLFARLLFDEPTFLQSVGVNLAVAHVFIGAGGDGARGRARRPLRRAMRAVRGRITLHP